MKNKKLEDIRNKFVGQLVRRSCCFDGEITMIKSVEATDIDNYLCEVIYTFLDDGCHRHHVLLMTMSRIEIEMEIVV